jgi:hypothetical protein
MRGDHRHRTAVHVADWVRFVKQGLQLSALQATPFLRNEANSRTRAHRSIEPIATTERNIARQRPKRGA